MIIKAMQVSPYVTNCFLLGDEDQGVCALVDPGDSAPELRRMVEESGLTLSMILLTHGHDDHRGAVPALRELYPAVPVYVHPLDYAEGGQGGMHQLPATTNVIFCREGDVLKLGGLSIEVLETPGHTPGSVTFRVGEVLFTGDTLFAGSMGRTDFPLGSYGDMMRSLGKLGALPGDCQVLPGHADFSTLEQERRSNYYLKEAMGKA